MSDAETFVRRATYLAMIAPSLRYIDGDYEPWAVDQASRASRVGVTPGQIAQALREAHGAAEDRQGRADAFNDRLLALAGQALSQEAIG